MTTAHAQHRSFTTTLTTVLTACLLVGSSLPAAGESGSTEETPWLESSVELGYFHQFESDLDDDGSFDRYGAFATGHFAARLTDRVRVRMLGTYHGVAYEFDDPPTIAGSAFKPWNTIHVARLNPMLDVELNEKLRIFGGPIFEASLENGADIADGFRPGGLVGAEYIVIPGELKVGLGVLGVAEIESGYYIQPLLLLEWRPTQSLTINAESWTTRGGSLELVYRALDQLEVTASVTYRREKFRLKERVLVAGPTPVFQTGSRGIGEDRAVVPALRISYFPEIGWIEDILGKMRVDLEVGVAVAGDLTIENRAGAQIQTISYDPAPSVGVNVVVPL